MYCPGCGIGQPDEHRFCISYGLPLPRELLPERQAKMTDLFLGIPTHPDDPAEPVLRVSRYLEDIEVTTVEGSVLIPATTHGSRSGRRQAGLSDEPVGQRGSAAGSFPLGCRPEREHARAVTELTRRAISFSARTFARVIRR
jgi:hypothetical protein